MEYDLNYKCSFNPLMTKVSGKPGQPKFQFWILIKQQLYRIIKSLLFPWNFVNCYVLQENHCGIDMET